MRKVPFGIDRAEFELLATSQQLRQDGRNHGSRRLTGPVRVEWSNGYDGQAETAAKALGKFIRADLAGGVWGLTHQRVRFVNGPKLRCSIGFACTRVDDAQHAIPTRRFQDIERAGDVGRHVVRRSSIRVWDANERRKMENDFLARKCVQHEVRVPNVPTNDFNFFEGVVGQELQVSPRGSRSIAQQRSHMGPLGHERLNQVRADKAAGARNDDAPTRVKGVLLHEDAFPNPQT